MSVVNKMLQDLESRQDQQTVPNADYVPSVKSRSWVWLVVVLVILLLAASGYWWYSEIQATEAVDKFAINEPTPAPVTVKNSESFEAEPVINQLQVSPQSEPENLDTETNVNQAAQSEEQLPQTSTFEFTSSKSPNTEQALKQQIQVALQLNDDSQAIELLKSLLTMTPENQVARKKLASLLFAQGMTNESKQIIQTGINLQPDVSDFRMMLARFYVQQKNIIEAHNTLREYSVSASIEPNLVSYRASLAKQLDRFELAKLDYLNLLASQPSNAKWWLGLAISEEKLGNNSSALKAYRKVNQLNQLSLEVSNFVQKRIQYLVGVL